MHDLVQLTAGSIRCSSSMAYSRWSKSVYIYISYRRILNAAAVDRYILVVKVQPASGKVQQR